ncbi:MAG: PIN domain-containing protein [Catonella sp.]|uniref:PIN domain-containing protein n=1 Tax=Catonella sp. TaxID=2382125 RepID=UPI003FA0D9C3
MDYYLIDLENIGADGINHLKDLKKDDVLYIFYTEQHKNISVEVMELLMEMKLEIIYQKVKTGTKNALDFQLSSYLGYMIGREEEDTNYHIVSNDKGYDCICDYWRAEGKNVDRIAPAEMVLEELSLDEDLENEPVIGEDGEKIITAKRSKVKSSDLATLEEIRELLSDEDEPEEILLLFNQYKTKQAIYNGISKKFKDSKRSGMVYKKLKLLFKEKNKS